MQHPDINRLGRIFATALAVAAMSATAKGAAIQFTKPLVPIAAPEKTQDDLPKARSKPFDLSQPQEIEAPYTPPPQPYRPSRRERDEDGEDLGRHPLLADPDNFPDAVGRDNARNGKPSSSKKSSNSNSRGNGMVSKNGGNGENALSPIKDLNWDPRDSDREDRRKDSLSSFFSGKSSRTEGNERNKRDESRQRDPYERQEKEEGSQPDIIGSSTALDTENLRTKSLPTPAQLERKAAFDELLNPGAGSIRPSSSLDPVTTLEPARAPITPFSMPTSTGPSFERGPFAIPDAFAARPEHPHAPVAENLSKKFSLQMKPAVPASTESPFQSSLMREPTVHQIPSRRF